MKPKITDSQILKLAVLSVGCFLIITACTPIVNRLTGKPSAEVKPKPQGGIVAVLDSNVIITEPVSNQAISSPVTIAGRASVPEGRLQVRIKDALNNILNATSTLAVGDSNWSQYSTTLEFIPTSPTGKIEVYSLDPNTDAEQNLISLPVVLSQYQDPVLNVYYSNVKEDPGLINCEEVYPIQRPIPFKGDIIVSLLNSLFSGLSDEEIAQGFVSSLPEEVVGINSLVLEGTTLTIDFNQALQEGVAGSCRVSAIRSQIEQTLLQLDGIDEVVISIEGETEGILQP